MWRPYSSSTTASHVAGGMPSRTHGGGGGGGGSPKTLMMMPDGAEDNSTSQRNLVNTLSIRSGRMAKRPSGRPLWEESMTFYSEATPPGSSRGGGEQAVPQPKYTYDGRYDHVAPAAALPVATICGIRRRRFLIVLWAVVVAVLISVAVPVGVVFGLRSSRHNNSTAESTNATSTTLSASFASSTGTASTSTTATSPTNGAASTSVVACPTANNTLYLVPDSSSRKTFRRFCGVDYSGADQARDLASVWTTTVHECMLRCADFSGCTGCGWGVIAGDDKGSEHRCWLKADLTALYGVRPGWDFAILEQ